MASTKDAPSPADTDPCTPTVQCVPVSELAAPAPLAGAKRRRELHVTATVRQVALNAAHARAAIETAAAAAHEALHVHVTTFTAAPPQEQPPQEEQPPPQAPQARQGPLRSGLAAFAAALRDAIDERVQYGVATTERDAVDADTALEALEDGHGVGAHAVKSITGRLRTRRLRGRGSAQARGAARASADAHSTVNANADVDVSSTLGFLARVVTVVPGVAAHPGTWPCDTVFADALQVATNAGDAPLTRALLLLDAPADVLQRHCRAVIARASEPQVSRLQQQRQVDVLAVLLEDPRVVLSEPGRLLETACCCPHPPLVRLLLAHARAADFATDAYANKALLAACEFGHSTCVRLLLADARLDPTAYDNEALLQAFAHGHTACARLLLADGRARVVPRVVHKFVRKHSLSGETLSRMARFLLKHVSYEDFAELRVCTDVLQNWAACAPLHGQWFC